MFLLPLAAALSQKSSSVLFYNVENLFDTINDPKTSDNEFTPKGRNKWTSEKYNIKIDNIATVISGIATRTLLRFCQNASDETLGRFVIQGHA